MGVEPTSLDHPKATIPVFCQLNYMSCYAVGETRTHLAIKTTDLQSV